MRAYNDGRYLETDLKLSENGKGITWGFALGEIKTSSMLRITAVRGNFCGESTSVVDSVRCMGFGVKTI
jgi:hypothetical protein